MKNTKKDIITIIYNICKERSNYIFDNDLIKDVLTNIGSRTNPYDMTKLDDISKFPEELIKEDYFIVHLGNGLHQFVKGLDKVFHKFEPITEEKDIIYWPYRPSILNDFSTSESSVLSLCFNQRIIHDFLYMDIVANPKVYNSERKNRISFDYKIGDIDMRVENLQIEIDLTTELNGIVTVFEGKNTKNSMSWLGDFNVYQLYNPFRYYYELKNQNRLDIKDINACYLIRQKQPCGSVVRLYKYTFTDTMDITSIKLLKKKEYRLKRREFDE